MVKLDKIYTRGGDKGWTSLGDGTRVLKHSLRLKVMGTIDESNAFIGLCCLYASQEIHKILCDIQHDLFDLGADLCTPIPSVTTVSEKLTPKNPVRIGDVQVHRLEKLMDGFNAELSPLNSFVLPGGSPFSTHSHLARTVVRRAERLMSALLKKEPVNSLGLIYLNRLSDLLFILGRYENQRGEKDVLWEPRKNQGT